MVTEIGKIRIRWEVKNDSIKNRLLNHYRDFLITEKKNTDIKIKVENNPFVLPTKLSSLISTMSWEYLKNKNKRFLYFPRQGIAEITRNFRNIHFYSPDEYGQLLLYLFPEILYSLILPYFKGILLHACGVRIKNKIFVFIAPTQGGKSTLVKLALRKNLTVLNDDRIILRKIKNKYFAFGNPWHGEVESTASKFGEIKELFFLKKEKKNYIQKIEKREMFFNILRNSFYLRKDLEHFKKVVEVISDIVDNIKGYILGFRPDLSIWRYLDERSK